MMIFAQPLQPRNRISLQLYIGHTACEITDALCRLLTNFSFIDSMDFMMMRVMSDAYFLSGWARDMYLLFIIDGDRKMFI